MTRGLYAAGFLVVALGAAALWPSDRGTSRDPQYETTLTVERVPTGLRAFTGTHTRVVWVQDVGDGTDVFARGDRLVLMGLDSDDGSGERAILGKPASYARPFVTPRGDRVIVSDRAREHVFVVNWDGSGLRALGAGTALTVWRDPSDGREWVYVGADREDDAYHTVRRFPIDRPDASELVWNQTLVGEEFQVSADGRRASGVFPWPEAGMAELPNGRLTLFGSGCWASMMPGDSYRLWYFDGAHRNLTLVETRTGRSWRVGLSSAPGIDGFEVYHPRWSNHPRFMTMTGPYTVGNDANRIRSGGGAVEVHVGRFSDDWSAIERWVRVTDNARADFYPDVWLDTRDVTPAGATATPGTASPGRPTAAARTDAALPARLVVEARLERRAAVPAPQAIRPYRHALVANVYRIERVVDGDYDGEHVMIAHWAIRDGSMVEGANRDEGRVYTMTLEPYDDRPELEGQRLIMDTDRFDLPLFYDLEQ